MSGFVECPCCRYPTLGVRGAFEICLICWWEDDGQDDVDADKVVGGPNQTLSLTAARANFSNHFDCFEAGEGIGAVSNPTSERKAILAYLKAVKRGDRTHDIRVLQGLLRADSDARRKALL